MAVGVPLQSLAAVAALCFGVANADSTLASYNFDYDVLDSGPDTYQVFRHQKSKAEISRAYAAGGYASAHLTDDAGDGDFVELQGYFPEQQSGAVRFRFKLLIASERNLFNVALAGRERYKLAPLGINLWLIYQDGWLRHQSDGIPKKLFQPNLYEWYAFDALLDLRTGTYTLRIARESGQTVLQLENQPFAPGADQQYSLKEFSFIGDLTDRQAANFYLDDILLTTSNETQLPPMVAPGRRKYFVEIWDDYHRQVQGGLRCLPATSVEDFGIDAREYASLTNTGQLPVLRRLIGNHPQIGKSADWESTPSLSAIVDWLKACDALENGKSSTAREHMTHALDKRPSAYIYQLTDILIAASESRDATSTYQRIYGLPHYISDARNQVALAMIAFRFQNYANIDHGLRLEQAFSGLSGHRSALRKPWHALGIQAMNDDYLALLRRFMPEDWNDCAEWLLILEQQYYALLWQEDHQEAYALASRVVALFREQAVAPGIWLERQADGAFLNKDLETALDLYNLQAAKSYSNLLKMADLYHMQGDLESERSLRESIFHNFTKRQ